MESAFNEYLKLIGPFDPLWNSARVTCVAVGPPMERKNLATRIALRGERLRKDEPFRVVLRLQPAPEVLIVTIEVPKQLAAQILFKAIENYRVELEATDTVDRVLLRWPKPDGTPPTQADFLWYQPFRLEGVSARNQFRETRTLLAISGMGGNAQDVMPYDLWQEVNSRLRLDPPHIDGFAGLQSIYLPGLELSPSSGRVAQIVFPLPLDLEQTDEGRLSLQAQEGAVGGRTTIVLNFEPRGEPATIRVRDDVAGPTDSEGRARLQWDIPWPDGAESGRATLYYAEKEVSSIELRRWPRVGTLRAAVDSYFDPDHKRLENALFGSDEKTSSKGKGGQKFEDACVRLMNLLSVPLIWYGGPLGAEQRKSDAAGLMDKGEKRVVVLAEFTEEKPEAKFSALSTRARGLSEHLQGDADVLPVVFTRAELPGTVSEAAKGHGIALVGRDEIRSLFELLSAPADKCDPLGLLQRLRSYSSAPPGLFGRYHDRYTP
jgi:hypothetical protein